MPEIRSLVILTPAFSADEAEVWLPWQNLFIRNLNRNYPQLRITVITFRHPAGSARHFSWEGNTVFIAGNQGGGKLRSLLLWKCVWSRLKAIRNEEKQPGILSLFCDECALVGHLFAKRHSLNHKIWILGQDALPKNRKVAQIRPAAGELVALSDFLERTFEASHGIRPAHTVPIGIDPAQFPPPVAKDIDLIAVGSLSGLKRHQIFIRVVAAIAERMPVRAVICGGGSEHHALQELIRELGLTDQIRITGMQTHRQALELMQRSRILLHTSEYEGFGLVCTEALFAGAEVLSFTRPMNAEIPRWQHVSGIEEMIDKTTLLLQNRSAVQSILPFHMDDTSRAIMSLLSEPV